MELDKVFTENFNADAIKEFIEIEWYDDEDFDYYRVKSATKEKVNLELMKFNNPNVMYSRKPITKSDYADSTVAVEIEITHSNDEYYHLQIVNEEGPENTAFIHKNWDENNLEINLDC